MMNAAAMLIQATAIMLALIILRPLLKRFLSARARCALWLIPALRLLFPVELQSIFSIMAPVQPISANIESAVSRPVAPPSWLGSGIGIQDTGNSAASAAQNISAAADTPSISLGGILLAVWLVGVVITGGIIIYQNVRFYSAVKRLSEPRGSRDGLPVYLVRGLPSPSLAGLFRPRIYINEGAISSKEVLEMSLLHELTHYRRLDHVWNALRGLLLAVYWFHPLVWVCSELFRCDCETACDEAAVRRMSAAEREAYGMTLITLASGGNEGNAGRFVCLSTMSGSKKLLKERITQLAKGRTFRCAALIALMTAVILCFTMCTMPSEESPLPEDTGSPSPVSPSPVVSEPEPSPVEANQPAEGQGGTLSDLCWFLEQSTLGLEFTDMDEARQDDILSEYRNLLEDYTLMARVSTDGSCAYIAGEYTGGGYSPHSSLFYTGINSDQVLYSEADMGAVESAMSLEEMPDSAYILTKSHINYSRGNNLILIHPAENELWLDTCFIKYISDTNGRAYIADAVRRGVSINSHMGPCLCVYYISEDYGEVAEDIPLTQAEAEAILAEEKVKLTDGFGFSAHLNFGDGDYEFYSNYSGVPQTVIDLSVEKCGYKFASPDYITGPLDSAVLECSWLDDPLYADEAELARLEEILKNAQFDGTIGACGYGAKLTLGLAGGEKMVVFKGTDDCDSIVFGSCGGYRIGDSENTEFWQTFGLDPATKEPAA